MSPPSADRTSCRVVLADDEPRLLSALGALLESTERIEVVAAVQSATAAEAACLEHEPDAVVLDVHMPGSGLAAARRLTRVLPGLRIVVLTADETPAVVAAARAAGAHAVLGKGGEDDVTEAVLGYGARTV